MTDIPHVGRVIRRAVLLRRFENHLVREVARIVDDLYDDLERLLRRQPIDDVSPRRRPARALSLTRQADTLIARAYRSARTTTQDALAEVARIAGQAAADELAARVASASGAARVPAMPTRATFRAIVLHDPVEGAPLAAWWRQFGRAGRERFRRQVQIGMARNEGVREIVQRVVGVRLRRTRSGSLLRLAHREAETLVRTAVQQVANHASVITYQENDDIVEGIEWLATLDDRTCPRCGLLDGRTWRLDDPSLRYPPEHPICRCTTIPVLVGVPHSSRENYDEWLAEQPPEMQIRILGKTRAAYYRQHRLTLAELIRSDGGFVTLDVLAKRYPTPRLRAA